ncbi:type II toxin-antitoxin system TacA family antitoxin [Novipirellula aureliae]|nr:DUF1778 domain-containing protein [Novipirellula aureliae]
MARIETRVSTEKKQLIERAAAYQGCSVSEFVIANAEQAAKAVIEEHEQLKLTRAQSLALVEVLLSTRQPNKRLRDAAVRHRKEVERR